MFRKLNKWLRIRHLESCIYRLSTPENAEKNTALINSMRIEIAALDGTVNEIKEVQAVTLFHWQQVVEQSKLLDASLKSSSDEARQLSSLLKAIVDIQKEVKL